MNILIKQMLRCRCASLVVENSKCNGGMPHLTYVLNHSSIDSIDDVILHAFSWELTPQGEDYWAETRINQRNYDFTTTTG